MNVVKAMQQAFAGMQNVEREIINLVRGRGGQLDAGKLLLEQRPVARRPPLVSAYESPSGEQNSQYRLGSGSA